MPKLPLDRSLAEYKILASSFIAIIGPLDEAGSFRDIYEAVKKEFPKADHYAYAYRKDGISKSTDDGEPSGTAGRPLLSFLDENDLDRVYVIVCRYFGGTKLGTPRLRRSFIESASMALEKLPLGELRSQYGYLCHIAYNEYDPLLSHLSKKGYRLERSQFNETVDVYLTSDTDCIDDLKGFLSYRDEIEQLGQSEYILKM